MNMKNRQRLRRRARVTAGLLGLLLVGACATASKQPPGEVVKARAQARWDALLQDRVDEAYAYFTPGYRSGLSLSNYYRRLAAQRFEYTGATVTGSECSEKSCKVKILVDFALSGVLPGVQRMDSRAPVEETWIFTDGDWYLLPEK